MLANGGLERILERLERGDSSLEEAIQLLRGWPTEDLGFARIDHHRQLRLGFPEVVYCPGKSPHQIADLMVHLAAQHPAVLATRATDEAYAAVVAVLPDAVYRPEARAIMVDRREAPSQRPGVAVLTGGTADAWVAEEAALTAELLGSQVERFRDVGVAGLHRLLDLLPRLQDMRVVVVVAGMDGVLPSVVGGLVAAPVIAVPTSVGYGAHFGGLAPLLTMLNSCAPGVAVVNIDNGFGAGYVAGLINARQQDLPASRAVDTATTQAVTIGARQTRTPQDAPARSVQPAGDGAR
jgi:hypothetical protein